MILNDLLDPKFCYNNLKVKGHLHRGQEIQSSFFGDFGIHAWRGFQRNLALSDKLSSLLLPYSDYKFNLNNPKY